MLSGPAGEPSNTRHPRGPRRKEARLQCRASPLFWVADLCPVLRSPQAQGRVFTACGGGRARCRPLEASSGGRGSYGRGRLASYHRTPGGASLRRGPVRHSRPRLVFLPQASGRCSALPTVRQGRALLLLTGRRPPIACDPSHINSNVAREGSVRPRRRHPRPAARRLAKLRSWAAILDRGQTTPPRFKRF
ncbi:hypothetical protein NDU88_009010 [Pleurodeles waltl]|uniref:Uncharacterized protein n=1 Tax=Pleurodeles waltl TaxID=8319 RepID=A0AAV7NXT9_PLEWA|nr:hypothetical protein NDU88_009010 [Pleurodeles waltl]